MVPKQTLHVSIIILNWNTWPDTIECLESVLKSNYPSFSIILIDNASTDSSVENVFEWAKGKKNIKIDSLMPGLVYPQVEKPVNIMYYKSKKISKKKSMLNNDIIFIQNDSNLGFAIANNIGIQLALNSLNSKYILLLNNDTVIEPNTILKLVESLEKNPDIGAATATIYRYGKNSTIANAGGGITRWATRRYYTSIKNGEIKKITFATGCALMVRDEIIRSVGTLSEKFFFGEEDFEFSLRLKKHGIGMICVSESRVYHKVGTSSDKYFDGIEKKIFLYGLNRLVNMKDYFSMVNWKVWKIFVLLYFYYLLFFKYKKSWQKSIKIIKQLNNKSEELNKVNRESFERIYSDLNL